MVQLVCININQSDELKRLSFFILPLDTEGKISVHKDVQKTWRTSTERLMHVCFTSCVLEVAVFSLY